MIKNDISERINHNLVKKTLIEVSDKYSLKGKDIELFAFGGQSIIFLIRSKKQILKVPDYFSRKKEEYEIIKHGIIKEVEVLRYCNSMFVPALIDFSPLGEFLLREFVDGETLMAIVKNKLLTSSQKTQFVEMILYTSKQIFKDFHENQRGCYVIRDFKPANIVFEMTLKKLYLVDLGSIRPEKDMVARTIKTSRLGSGKWLHWSIEQLIGNQELLDRRTDYFALGSTIFYVLSGISPFSNLETDYENVMKIYNKEYDKAIDTLDVLNNEFQISLNKIEFIKSCLNPDATKRPNNFAYVE